MSLKKLQFLLNINGKPKIDKTIFQLVYLTFLCQIMISKSMSSIGKVNLNNVMKDANRVLKWGEKKMTPSRLYLASKFLVIFFEEERGMRLSEADEEALRSRVEL